MRMAHSSSGTRVKVAAEVRAEMARQRLSQVELAKRLGKGQPWVSRRVNAEVAFDLDDLDLVAAALDVSLARLLGWTADADNYRRTTDGYSGDSQGLAPAMAA
jgi:transcriptional regulator with XRE-family HTH domain